MSNSENSGKPKISGNSDKENARAKAKPSFKKKRSLSERDALATLSENKILTHPKGKYEVVSVETVENLKSHCWKSQTETKTTTLSKKRTGSLSEKIKEADEEDGEEKDVVFVTEPEESKKVEVTEKDHSENIAKKPARKTTLQKKLTERRKQNGSHSSCVFSTADQEYFKENFYCLAEQDKKWVVQKAKLQNADFLHRVLAVNWLVQLQQNLKLPESTTLVASRTFDNILVKAKIPPDQYILIATVCFWIISKNMERIIVISASKLSKICNRDFTKDKIIYTEKKILKLINFQIATSDPLAFLEFYIREVNLEETIALQDVRTYGIFLIEILMYSWEFSTYHSAYFAAAIVYLLLLKHNKDATSFLIRRSNSGCTKIKLIRCATCLESALKVILKYFWIEKLKIFAKYSSSEKSYIIKLFTD